MLFGLQVLKVAIKYLDSMHPSAAGMIQNIRSISDDTNYKFIENIKEWILVMEGFMKAQGVGKARILSEKQTMGTRSLIRQGELTSISRACIQNIMTCEAMQRQALVSRGNRPIATKQQKQTLSSGSQILVSNQVKNVEGRPVASKYPRWVENSIEPFALLPEATHVDVSFGMSAERVKFFTSESPAAIEYKLHMTVYNKDDITKRHVWPPSLQSVDLNSFRLNLQRKMYVGGPQGRYRTTGYDIPLDLSVYLKMGTNVLRIQLRPDVLQKEYVVQIEVVVLLTKKQAFDCVTGRQFLDEATTIQQGIISILLCSSFILIDNS